MNYTTIKEVKVTKLVTQNVKNSKCTNSLTNKKKSCTKIKKKSKGFVCDICGHISTSSQRHQGHLSRHTGKKNLECKICGKKFAWRYSFNNHMVLHSSDNPNKCNFCEKKYCSKSALKAHVLRKHSNVSKQYECTDCHLKFFTHAELKSHGLNHSGEKPYMCEYCGNTYKFKGALVVHYRLHSGEKPYQCDICELKFTHKSSAICHRAVHLNEKTFHCDTCEKNFSTKRALTAHNAVHSDKRPFKCKSCEKTFRSRTGFRVHLDFHLGLKRHICKHCGRAFRAWNNMIKHAKRHLTNKSYKCRSCSVSFINMQQMKSHIKSHCSFEKEKNYTSCKVLSHISPDSDSPDDPSPLPTDLPSPAFVNPSIPVHDVSPQPLNLSENSNHPHVPQTNRQLLFPNDLHDDKIRFERYNFLQDNYVPQFVTPQPVDSSFVPYSCNFPTQHSIIHSNQMINNKPSCVSDISSSSFNNAPAVDYGTYFNSQSIADDLIKCKFCPGVYQSVLDLKQHLLIYHRIEEQNIEEALK